MRRRDLLLGAPALLGTARAAERPPTLRDAAGHAGLLVASSSETDLDRDPAYAALIADNVSLFAPNMSWQRMSPTPEQTGAGLDPNLRFAAKAGLRLTGYHLLWHQRLPDWFAALDTGAAERAIVDHIERIGARWGPATYSWNVVNEAIRPADGMVGGLRRSELLAKFGTVFFDLAYHTAQRVRPGAIRVYNDYDLELDTPDQRQRRAALFRLLDECAARSVPLQAVGLQSHLRTRSFDWFDPRQFRRFLDDIAARGLDILITELDVHDLASGSIPARDAQVADIYRRFLDTALSQPRVRVVGFWGLSDRYSWLNDPARPNDARPDGQPGRPAPFDAQMQPKPAWRAVVDAFESAPRRPDQR